MANRIALTVDLEPDWGMAGTRAFREVTPRFLRFLEERNMRATFFVVSDLADVDPGVIEAIAERHEIGSHGRTHAKLDRLDRAEAERELGDSRARLQEFGGPVRGFRAPFFRRCPGFGELVRGAGYEYDASRGSVIPGPHNGRLARMPSPFRDGALWGFATSAMAGGLLPLSLTWLRLCAPLAAGTLPKGASLVYLHLHEFLAAETARCLSAPLRHVLTRNCGERAWGILDGALARLGAEFTTCGELLDERLSANG